MKRLTARLCLRTGTSVTELRSLPLRDLLELADEIILADKERRDR